MHISRRNFIKGSAIVGASIASPMILRGDSGMWSMTGSRKVHRILNSDRTKVGTLPILRAFAGDHLDYVSPYVLFDEFGPVDLTPGSEPLRVNAHPHAGFSPTTYFLSGSGHHKDSLNYDFQVEAGEFMLFNAGRGAIHMEETGQKLHDEGGSYHGFQIWLNSPAKHKYVNPTTDVFGDDHLYRIQHRDYVINIVIGTLFGKGSAVQPLSPAFYYHVEMNANTRLDIPTDPSHNAFVYLVGGDLEVEGQRAIKQHQIILYKRDASDINLYSKSGAELMVLGGEPLNETVFSYGPFVMNSREQIRQCILDYRAGKMGDPDQVN